MTDIQGLRRPQSRTRPRSSQSFDNRGDEIAEPVSTRTHRSVKRSLHSIHIFLITVSGTIGMGLFDNSGEILRIAGPVGGIMAYIIVGSVVICVMDGVAEMVGYWPIANCMVEFVAKFVDEELAIIVGIAYWYGYAIGFQTLIVAAANLADFWNWSVTLQDFMFVGAMPLLLLALNCLGVLWYANVESVLGVLKMVLVVGSFLTMVVLNATRTSPDGQPRYTYIDDGFQHEPTVAASNTIAVLVAIPIATYAYAGVEIVAATALEAKNPAKSLKHPAKLIAWFTALTYILSVVGFYLNVSWSDVALPILAGRKNTTMARDVATNGTTSTNATTGLNLQDTNSTSIVIIATIRAGVSGLPDLLNVGLICVVLSTANTSLYVASRTLYGLTGGLDPKDKFWIWRFLSKLSVTSLGRKIPTAALVFSALFFCWVPFLRLNKSYTDQQLQEIMSGIATVAIVLVWASLCLAFIRYRRWLSLRESSLKNNYAKYDPWTKNTKLPFRTILSWAQPIPAYIGLILCLLIVFVFATSSWWNGQEEGVAIWAALAGPLILSIIWTILKWRRYLSGDFEWYVKLGPFDKLAKALDALDRARRDDEDNDGRSDSERDLERRPLNDESDAAYREDPSTDNWIRSHRDRDSAQDSGVSPRAGHSRHAQGPSNFEVIELAPYENPEFKSSAASRMSSAPRPSISESATRRKPVSTGSIASTYLQGTRDSERSVSEIYNASEQQPRFTNPDPFDNTALSPSTTLATTPRRSQNELIPPDRYSLTNPSTSSSPRPRSQPPPPPQPHTVAQSQIPEIQIQAQGQNNDLETQDMMRDTVWRQQRVAVDPIVSPQVQESPAMPSGVWNGGRDRISRRAISEPDAGVGIGDSEQSQPLSRHRDRDMERGRGRRPVHEIEDERGSRNIRGVPLRDRYASQELRR